MAQIAYCWLTLYGETSDSRYRDAAIAANSYLRRTVLVDGPPDIRGGVKGSFPIDGEYGKYQYLSWAAKFLVDSLVLEQNSCGRASVGGRLIPTANAGSASFAARQEEAQGGTQEGPARLVRRFFSFGPEELLRALRSAGVQPGDSIMVHAAFESHHGFRGSVESANDTFSRLSVLAATC